MENAMRKKFPKRLISAVLCFCLLLSAWSAGDWSGLAAEDQAILDVCAEVIAAADQSKITVARIDTLDDAQTTVEQYAAGNTSDLPKCPADGADNNEKGQ